MSISNNYPPGCSGGVDGQWTVTLFCPYGHPDWEVSTYSELGGVFYDGDTSCPECGAEGIDQPIYLEEVDLHDAMLRIVDALTSPEVINWEQIRNVIDDFLANSWEEEAFLSGQDQNRLFRRLRDLIKLQNTHEQNQ